MADVFNVAIFFILFRETLEAAIIVSVMLSFISSIFHDDPGSYRRARKQIWIGASSGFAICLIIGAIFIAVFYTLSNDLWSKAENLWEGIFCLVAACMISLMGIGFLRSGRMQDKWRVKLARAMGEPSAKRGWRRFVDFKVFSTRYLFFHLPFLTVLREGLEAVVFVGGVSLGISAKSIPLPVVVGIACGSLVGYLIYRTGNAMSFHWFFVATTCLLYLIAAGLFSRSVWFFENHVFARYAGADPDTAGVFDVRVNVWKLDYGDPEANDNTAWGIFNAVLGWTNVATLGSVIGYCLYWAAVASSLVVLRVYERKHDREAEQASLPVAAHFAADPDAQDSVISST
ncbi:high-affinity iron permease [Coemansia sp. RSA 2611]|nr:high-affinity iron permease [Coemansia sp. RSA 2610]KAJ2392473.1 high-affinity iron permease [Coemansia sp. RSA 2611]